MASPRRFRSISRKPNGDFFRIAHTQLLGGVYVHFGGYDLHLRAKIA